MISRQPNNHVGLRIVAASCIVLWLVASSCCGIEHLFGDDHHHAEAGAAETLAHHDIDHSEETEAAEHRHGDAGQVHDSEPPSQDSHHHNDGEDSCCSSFQAMAQSATPFVIAKPALPPLNVLYTVHQAHDPMVPGREDKWVLQAKPRESVFTPEVCLGPAHRSLAPPSFT